PSYVSALSLHDALPIWVRPAAVDRDAGAGREHALDDHFTGGHFHALLVVAARAHHPPRLGGADLVHRQRVFRPFEGTVLHHAAQDRKSTRLNSSHGSIA